jgi:hypothetical protein
MKNELVEKVLPSLPRHGQFVVITPHISKESLPKKG